ncbi:hypothetical protein GRS96_12225 [Rathayibacter sp. VKM Ac-2803]|nr:hypothetical protein [Rathayibacter sp. VKM Ac-2803]
MAHIVPWETVRAHDFSNMLVLCHNCHWRYDTTKEIDRKSIRAYKMNLSVLNARYSDYERRVLEALHLRGENSSLRLSGGDSLDVLLQNVQRDGLVSREADVGMMYRSPGGGLDIVLPGAVFNNAGLPRSQVDIRPENRLDAGLETVSLTAAGIQFIQQWFGAVPLDDAPPATDEQGG